MTRSACLKPKHDPCDFYPNCDCGAVDRLRENLVRVLQEDVSEKDAAEIWRVANQPEAAK